MFASSLRWILPKICSWTSLETWVNYVTKKPEVWGKDPTDKIYHHILQKLDPQVVLEPTPTSLLSSALKHFWGTSVSQHNVGHPYQQLFEWFPLAQSSFYFQERGNTGIQKTWVFSCALNCIGTKAVLLDLNLCTLSLSKHSLASLASVFCMF